VPALSQLLERLRRVRLPPGAAAGVVAVPSAGDELEREVGFLFGELDELERAAEALRSAARADAAEVQSTAEREARRLLEEAREQGERLTAEIIAGSRAGCEQRARAMLADAEREAERLLARGRKRTPAVVEEIIMRVLEDAA
jgi:vacuolar-type H+-ATPase subunit H